MTFTFWLFYFLIIIFCSIDSSNVNARSTPLQESSHRSLSSLQTTFTLTECTLLIFLQYGVEPTTLDLGSQSGALDLSATATPFCLSAVLVQGSSNLQFICKCIANGGKILKIHLKWTITCQSETFFDKSHSLWKYRAKTFLIILL